MFIPGYLDQFDPDFVICVRDLVAFCMTLESERVSHLPLGSEAKAGYVIAIRDILTECHRLNTEYKSIDFQKELSKEPEEENSWKIDALLETMQKNKESSHTIQKEDFLSKLNELLMELRKLNGK